MFTDQASLGRSAMTLVRTDRAEIVGEHVLRNGWAVAVTLNQQAGEWVVTEMRVFPDPTAHGREPGRAEEERIGTWSHTQEAVDAAPAGGLTTAVLRGIRLAALAADHKATAVRVAKQDEAGLLLPHPSAHRRLLTEAGSQRERLAWTAYTYVSLVESGTRNPAPLIAQMTGLEVRTVHTRLNTARAAGLLTRPAPGRTGGDITPEARELLGLDPSQPEEGA